MPGFASGLACRRTGGILAGLLCGSAMLWPAFGAQTPAAPDFGPDVSVGWISYGPLLIPPKSGPGPVSADPAHPYHPNPPEILAGQPNAKVDPQPNFPVSDVTNPILQPWARAALEKLNALTLAGKPFRSKHSTCWPMGVPAWLLYPVAPVYFLQTPKEVVMIWRGDGMVRHVYLNAPHSPNRAPSWFGDSIGHYEGDTLVVDTIGLNDRTYVDEFHTPHSDKLHVVERYHMIEGGKTMEVDLHVEDPGAFTTPWNASQRYRRVQEGPLVESPCAENPANYFHEDFEPMPQADKPDF